MIKRIRGLTHGVAATSDRIDDKVTRLIKGAPLRLDDGERILLESYQVMRRYMSVGCLTLTNQRVIYLAERLSISTERYVEFAWADVAKVHLRRWRSRPFWLLWLYSEVTFTLIDGRRFRYDIRGYDEWVTGLRALVSHGAISQEVLSGVPFTNA